METAIAQAVTLTEPDVGLVTCKVITTTLVDDIHSGAGPSGISPLAIASTSAGGSHTAEVKFWHTSQGKFRFTLEELPAQLQLIYSLMLVSFFFTILH